MHVSSVLVEVVLVVKVGEYPTPDALWTLGDDVNVYKDLVGKTEPSSGASNSSSDCKISMTSVSVLIDSWESHLV